jgi:diaminopimelate epimerase
MTISFYKYHGAGNDFIIIDNRSQQFPSHNQEIISQMCDRRFGVGGDGLILLENDINSDFKMVYFNADGKEGSMCGNGGRCVVSLAKKLGIIENETQFSAIDGVHFATIANELVSLKMSDIGVNQIVMKPECTFLNTGSPHHVEFHEGINGLDVISLGKQIRFGEPYTETGTNVNFVAMEGEERLAVRTYERGVENETLACGTGVTAAAIAAHSTGRTTANHMYIKVLGGQLEVFFQVRDNTYTEVYLKGPAELVFSGEISIE